MTCGKLLRSQRKFRILSAKQGATVPSGVAAPPPPPAPPTPTPPVGSTTDLLELAEIYEPEFKEETHDCDPAATTDPCADVTIATQVGNNPRKASCLVDADGQHRCLFDCTNPLNDDECGVDFECYPSAFGGNRCMRAPIGGPSLWQKCMPELQEYEVHVGDAFTVSGTASGYLSNERAGAGGECEVPPQTLERVRLTQWRVPLTAPNCPANVNASPLAESIDPTVLASNVCSVQSTGTGVALIHFENPIFNIVAQLPLGAEGATAGAARRHLGEHGRHWRRQQPAVAARRRRAGATAALRAGGARRADRLRRRRGQEPSRDRPARPAPAPVLAEPVDRYDLRRPLKPSKSCADRRSVITM